MFRRGEGTPCHRTVTLLPLSFLRVLSFNNLTRLDEDSLADLSSLSILRLSHNSISHISEGAFRGLRNLRVLYVSRCGVGMKGFPLGGRDRPANSLSLAASQTRVHLSLYNLYRYAVSLYIID